MTMDQLLLLKFHIPISFSSDNYNSYRIVIAKTLIIDLGEGNMALRLITGCSYWLHKAKSKRNSPWSDQIRQTKPLSNFSDDISAGQPGWFTKVAEL